ncbi:MAG: hypothetical protein AB1765_09355 [Candidatus Hydrogenedentota bacterium]
MELVNFKPATKTDSLRHKGTKIERLKLWKHRSYSGFPLSCLLPLASCLYYITYNEVITTKL